MSKLTNAEASKQIRKAKLNIKRKQIAKNNETFYDFARKYYQATKDNTDKLGKTTILADWKKEYLEDKKFIEILRLFKYLGFRYKKNERDETGNKGVILGLKKKITP